MPFCHRCGGELPLDALYCPSCGVKSSAVPTAPSYAVAPHPMKNPGVATLLAAVLGAFIFLGIGQIYVGRIGRGLVILLLGFMIDIPFVISLLFFWLGWPILVVIALGVASLALWIWSIYDAHKLAKQYNEHLRTYGRPPW